MKNESDKNYEAAITLLEEAEETIYLAIGHLQAENAYNIIHRLSYGTAVLHEVKNDIDQIKLDIKRNSSANKEYER